MNKNRKMSVIYTGKEKCQVNGRQKDHENKKALKTALIELLDKQDFEHVSITELCRKADVSRKPSIPIIMINTLFWTIFLRICSAQGRQIITDGRKRTIPEGTLWPDM